MKPIRILQVVTIMNRGGLETMLMNYYRKVDHKKIQFDFMVHRNQEGDYDQEILKLGGRIYRMPQIRPGNYRDYFKCLDDFFANHPEFNVVHSHINENSSFVLRAAKKANIQVRIAHSHLAGLPFDYKFPFRMYARLFLKKNASQFFACSDEAGEWLFGKNFARNNNIIVLKNAIDTKEFRFSEETRDKVRKDLELEGKFVIGHVGRFNTQKNHDFLIDIFNEIHKEKKDTVLVLVGEGKLEDEIKKKVERLNLSNSVKFLGLRSDVANIMQAMDLFLFPSLYEGLGVVLIEAQAAGLKCITSTGTPKEADVSDSVDFLGLDKTASEWANHILKYYRNNGRKNNIEIITQKGYDVLTNIGWLTNNYIKTSEVGEELNKNVNSIYTNL